jgi:hypothetical protein
MTVALEAPSSTFTGNGVTTQFAFKWRLDNAAWVVVMVNGIITTSGWAVTLQQPSGGILTFTAAPTDGVEVFIARQVPVKRDTNYVNQASIDAVTVNWDQDLQSMMLQDFNALNSVTYSKLSSVLTQLGTLDQAVSSAQGAATRAQSSAQGASASASEAEQSANEAANSETQAEQVLTQVQTTGSSALGSISTAESSALSALSSARSTGVAAVNGATSAGVTAVQNATESGTSDLTDQTSQALQSITTSQSQALSAVSQARTQAVNSVNSLGTQWDNTIKMDGQSAVDNITGLENDATTILQLALFRETLTDLTSQVDGTNKVFTIPDYVTSDTGTALYYAGQRLFRGDEFSIDYAAHTITWLPANAPDTLEDRKLILVCGYDAYLDNGRAKFANIMAQLMSGGNVTITVNPDGTFSLTATIAYDDITEKPSINNVPVDGNKTGPDYNLVNAQVENPELSGSQSTISSTGNIIRIRARNTTTDNDAAVSAGLTGVVNLYAQTTATDRVSLDLSPSAGAVLSGDLPTASKTAGNIITLQDLKNLGLIPA